MVPTRPGTNTAIEDIWVILGNFWQMVLTGKSEHFRIYVCNDGVFLCLYTLLQAKLAVATAARNHRTFIKNSLFLPTRIVPKCAIAGILKIDGLRVSVVDKHELFGLG